MDINQILTKNTQDKPMSYTEGCLLLVDKPLEWTSFDVVNKIRFAIKHKFDVKKIKVGHAGTLDPLATGLLLICTGPYTKKIDTLQNESKVYTGIIQLGATTPTFDKESSLENIKTVPPITDEILRKIEQNFMGDILQIPPVYSAIKIKGQKSYQLARRGEDVEMVPRPVVIYKIELTKSANNQLEFLIHCSKGTYIRSMANDIGKFIGCGGFLFSLRRKSIAEYNVVDALSVDEVVLHIHSSPMN